jgi:hypothetical protein
LAQNGDAEAQTDLGDMYREGLGVSQDYAEAAILYRRAADQGENLAQMLLGRLYAAGQGVAQDYVQGHVWLNLAASRISNGEVRDATVKERDDLASKMTPDQIAEAQRMAREWKPTKR